MNGTYVNVLSWQYSFEEGSSKFGDTKLFFKHQWIEDDVALKPEWTDAYFNECFCNRP